LCLLELVLRESQVHWRVIGRIGVARGLQLVLRQIHRNVRWWHAGTAADDQRHAQGGRHRKKSAGGPRRLEKDVHHHIPDRVLKRIVCRHNPSLQRTRLQGPYVDIGYFLKLMVDKGASDMFLSTGAPVNIKVEG